MMQLIFAVLAIALMAGTALAAVTYINPAPVLAASMAKRLDSGFSGLRDGVHSYFSLNGAMPGSMGVLTPQYAFIPPAPDGAQWTFTAVDPANGYVCFSGSFTRTQIMALLKLKQDFSPQAYFVSSACGATADQSIGGPASAAATLWVTSNG